MRKSTIKKLFLTLGIIIFLLSSAGCNNSETGKTPPIEPPKALFAETYMQPIAMSAVYSLEITVDGDTIYVNDMAYQYVSYEEDLELTYEHIAPIKKDEAEANATLEKLKAQKGCHVIENKDRNSNRIAIYQIEGIYYFVSYTDNGNAVRIHKESITEKNAVNILNAWTGDFSEEKLKNVIKTYQKGYKNIVFQSESDAANVTFETPFEISSCSVSRLSVVDDNDINVELKGYIDSWIKTSFDKNQATISTNWWLSQADWTRDHSVWSYLVRIKDVEGIEHYYYFRVDYSNFPQADK